MEVTVIDTGDLPASTIISFHSGPVRRHVTIEKDKSVSLAQPSGSEPVRVDLMSQVGTHTFDMVPGQDVYDVPISTGGAGDSDVRLKFQIREAGSAKGDVASSDAFLKDPSRRSPDGMSFAAHSPVSPSRKLQTALMMRSYLDSHDVLRQMQDLLQDMVTHRPEDPIDFMIKRLEEVCQSGQNDVILEGATSAIPTIADEPPAASAPQDSNAAAMAEAYRSEQSEEQDSDEDDDFNDPELDIPPPIIRTRKCSVSEEAYGDFNKRREYQKKVIPKDDAQKQRLREVLGQCWMFQSHNADGINTIIDAMAEKVVEPQKQLIQQGDSGEVMWVVEEGVLECFKMIDGVNKSVKVCKRGDVFGELALLYNCPRAASVFSKERCVLWELDRDTFKAICYQEAKRTCPKYEGFTEPEAKKRLDGPKARRREGVSAEATRKCDGDNWVSPVYTKTAEERQQLFDIIRTSHDSKLHMLFGTVNKETFEKIVDAMQMKAIAKGESVIKQGDVGDFFYIVKSGYFDIIVKKGADPPKKVFEAGVGFAFGELALLYNAPRSATITASEPSEVWALDRTAFRNLVVLSAKRQFRARVDFLVGVDIFQVLNEREQASLAEVLEEEEFQDDEAILEQDEKDDKMFILQTGKAVACIKGEQGEVEVMQYSSGEYFGEIALLSGEPRKASVYAVGPCTCLYISRPTFLRILGPLKSLLERNFSKYEKYQTAIAHAEQHEPELDHRQSCRKASTCQQYHEEEFMGGVALDGKKDKTIIRKRERKSAEDISSLDNHKKVDHELPSETPPETLADKVAQDLKNPTLVSPSQDFELPNTQMMMFGGLVSNERFTQDKAIHFRSKAAAVTQNGLEETYEWNGQTKLDQATEISIICQKGQKSASDPTPNQDNFFVHHIGSATVYGVADGHGPFGHLVSFRIVQNLPYFISKSEHAGKDWEQCLKEAFLNAQLDLCEFCGAEGINIEASGAAASVVLLEEQTVHIAHIGDARVMLGSWNRRDSRLIFCTKDHKPENPEERERLEANGSEVREIDPGNFRIYLPGSNFPGLTMSRAFGDTVCGGVLREPEYHKELMQPTDQWYCILASDGIWEFMGGEEVLNLTAKKLRLKGPRETLGFLLGASRKRWNYCCGDYCDDISAILVQWNASSENKGSKKNHILTVTKPAAS